MRKIYVSQFMQPRFPNLQAYESPMCVGAVKHGAEREKIQITTLQLCKAGEKILTLFIIKTRKEKRAGHPEKEKISEKAWQMFTQITNLSPAPIFPLRCVYLNGYRIGK